MADRRSFRLDIAIYVIFAGFYLWMAAQIPYTHDDWDWGLPVGIQQLLNANLNSRYVGNFFEVVMTRSEILKTLIMGAGYWVIPFMIAVVATDICKKQTGTIRLISFLLVNILLLSMDRKVWQQTYGWVAGYANFVISAFFMTVIFREALRIYGDCSHDANRFCIRTLLLFLLALTGQLFLENVALIMVLFSLWISLVHYRKSHMVSLDCIAMVLGSVLGLVIIFSSSLYHTLWTTGSAVGGYRQLHINANMNIWKVIHDCIYQAAKIPYHFGENHLITCLAVLLLLTAALLQRRDLSGSKRWGCVGVNVLLTIYLLVNHVFGIVIHIVVLSLISVVIYLTVAIQVIFLFRSNKHHLHVLLTLWIAAPAMTLPLIVTSELGSRLFFTSNILMILFAATLAALTMDRAGNRVPRYVTACCTVVALVLLLCHGRIYYQIGACKAQRDTIIAQAVEDNVDTIVLPTYPYAEYLWSPDPDSDLRQSFFKDFYGIPQDTVILFE